MLVPILLDSQDDETFARKIAKYLGEFEVKTELYIASAHKVPELVLDIVDDFNKSGENLVYITVSSQSNALSGIVAASALHPVIACPNPSNNSDYLTSLQSSLAYPSDTPSLCVTDPQNAAMAAIRILALASDKLRKQVAKHIAEMKDVF